MRKLKVAILGVGKIGQFHAREFKQAGCEVVAILTNSFESAKVKSEKLNELYGINARPYFDLDKLLKTEKLDIVSICTPPETHFDFIKLFLENNINVLSEKPFVFENSNNYNLANKLFELANMKKLVLSCNTQWVSILDNVPKKFISDVKSFSIYMEPPLDDIVKLIVNVIPHMNSFLIRLLGNRNISDLRISREENGCICILFNYGVCKVKYIIGTKEERPRKFYFEINGVHFEKKISMDYKHNLIYNDKTFSLEDPLKVSIYSFVKACENNNNRPLVNKDEIMKNIEIQDFIVEKTTQNKIIS